MRGRRLVIIVYMQPTTRGYSGRELKALLVLLCPSLGIHFINISQLTANDSYTSRPAMHSGGLFVNCGCGGISPPSSRVPPLTVCICICCSQRMVPPETTVRNDKIRRSPCFISSLRIPHRDYPNHYHVFALACLPSSESRSLDSLILCS